MGTHRWKLANGIYPVIPGLTIRLGDYGYWDGPQWCHVGNIEELPGDPIYLTKREENPAHKISDGIEVDIKANGEAAVTDNQLNAGISLEFKKKNSQYFFGTLTKNIHYSSIDMEVEPFLRELLKNGKWKKKYWLAWSVYYSDQFVTLRSTSSAVKVGLHTDLKLETLKSGGSLKAKFSFAPNSVEVVESSEDEKFAGAKFLSLEDKGWIKRNLEIKYNIAGEDDLSFG